MCDVAPLQLLLNHNAVMLDLNFFFFLMNSFKCCSTIIYFYSFCALVKIHMASLLALVQCLQYFSSKYLKPLTFSGKKKKRERESKKNVSYYHSKRPCFKIQQAITKLEP